MNSLWVIAVDDEKSFSDRLVSNGWIDREWRLPFAFCPDCDLNDYAGGPLSMVCPPSLKAMLLDARRNWGLPRIPRPEFDRLLSEWQKAFADAGGTAQLQSGDSFAPAVWHVPVKPRRRLYEAIANWCGYILPIDVCDVLLQHHVTGLHAIALDAVRYMTDDHVHARRVFKDSNSADRRRRLCEYEFSDIRFAELTRVTTALIYHSNEVIETQCKTCGRSQRRNLPAYDQRMKRLRDERHIPAEHIPDVDIFVCGPANGIIFKERAFRLLPAEILVDFDIQEWTPLT